jgi:hypothetical protein
VSKDDDKMSLQEACNQTRQFARFLKGMNRLSEAATALENSASVVAENENSIVRLKAERAKAESALDVARAAVEDANAALAKASAEIKDMLAAAAVEAGALLTTARSKADDQDRRARAAEDERNAALVARDAAKAEEKAVGQRIADAKAHLRTALG